jgi:hypothetical protein
VSVINSRVQNRFWCNLLNVVNVTAFTCTLNVLVLTSLAMKHNILIGYKRKQCDNEAGSGKDSETSSSRDTMYEK